MNQSLYIIHAHFTFIVSTHPSMYFYATFIKLLFISELHYFIADKHEKYYIKVWDMQFLIS